MWASDFVFKADLFAREFGDVNPGIPFWPEGGDTAKLSFLDAVCGQ